MTLRPALAALLAALALPAVAVGHRADVAIVDRATGAQLPVLWHEGRAYVVGRPGNEYQVVVRNRRGEDLLAVVSVDGLNVMDGRTASPSQGGYVLSPWERLDVRGWRKSLEEVAAFYFTSLGDSYAGRTGRPRNVGVIGVALFHRKPVHHDVAPLPYRREPGTHPLERREAPQAAPEASTRAQESGAANDSARERHAPATAAASAAPPPAASVTAPLGTGHGRRESSRVRWVDFERASDTPAETITIHYDSYRNLVAQGVLTPYAQRRHPDPFPNAFTPDP